MNQSAAFLGPRTGWRGIRLGLNDVHGLWGGHTLDLYGTGLGWASIIDRTGHEQRVPLVLTPAAVAAMLDLLITHDFLSLTFPARPGVPDEARPVVSVTNPSGEARAVAKWANDPSPAFEAVYQALLGIAREAEGRG